MDLLAAEITAVTGKEPGEHFRELTAEFGTPYYTRIDAAATPEQKAKLVKTFARSRERIQTRRRHHHRQADARAGQPCRHRGIEGRDRDRWFAARPSGTENIYKIYAESFRDEAHLQTIVGEAQQIVNNALAGAA